MDTAPLVADLARRHLALEVSADEAVTLLPQALREIASELFRHGWPLPPDDVDGGLWWFVFGPGGLPLVSPAAVLELPAEERCRWEEVYARGATLEPDWAALASLDPAERVTLAKVWCRQRLLRALQAERRAPQAAHGRAPEPSAAVAPATNTPRDAGAGSARAVQERAGAAGDAVAWPTPWDLLLEAMHLVLLAAIRGECPDLLENYHQLSVERRWKCGALLKGLGLAGRRRARQARRRPVDPAKEPLDPDRPFLMMTVTGRNRDPFFGFGC